MMAPICAMVMIIGNLLKRLATTVVAIVLALHFISSSQSALAQKELPPAAGEALENGIIAAKMSDFELAIRYFQDARKLAPNAPVLFYNLGLAESKIPGRELRAICWLAAFLAAEPDAANASAIEEQIKFLRIKNQSNLSRIIRTIEDNPSRDMYQVISLWAKVGDPTAIRRVTQNFEPISKSSYLNYALAFNWSVESASEIASWIDFPTFRCEAYQRVALFQFQAGNSPAESLRASRQAADVIQIPDIKADCLNNLAAIQIKIGDPAAARATLAVAASVADEIDKNPSSLGPILRVPRQISTAAMLVTVGDLELARETIKKAKAGAASVASQYGNYQFDICGVQALFDIPGAVETLKIGLRLSESIADSSIRENRLDYAESFCRRPIAVAQAKAGDVDAAVKTALQSRTLKYRAFALGNIVEHLLGKGQFDLAEKTAEKIDAASGHRDYAFSIVKRAKEGTWSPADTAPKPPSVPPKWTAAEWLAQILKLDKPQYTDIGAFLKSLPADNPKAMFDALNSALSGMVENDILIAQRLQSRKQ